MLCHFLQTCRVMAIAVVIFIILMGQGNADVRHTTHTNETTQCLVPDDIYEEFVLVLKDRTFQFLEEFVASLAYDQDGHHPPAARPIIDAYRQRLRSNQIPPLDRLWVSLCEIEGYAAWVERTREQTPVNGSTELAYDAGFLSSLVHTTVMILRGELNRLERCESLRISTTPTATATDTPTSTIGQSETSTSQSPPMPIIDRHQTCHAAFKLRSPHPGRLIHPRRLASILGGMMEAVARLDFLLKRFFTY